MATQLSDDEYKVTRQCEQSGLLAENIINTVQQAIIIVFVVMHVY